MELWSGYDYALPLRPFIVFCVLPFAVNLDFRHLSDTLGYLGYYLNHVIPLMGVLVLDNVLLEHGVLLCVLPFAVHLDFHLQAF